jgi:hypothetical protein
MRPSGACPPATDPDRSGTATVHHPREHRSLPQASPHFLQQVQFQLGDNIALWALSRKIWAMHHPMDLHGKSRHQV